MKNKNLDPLFKIIKKEINRSKRGLFFLGLPVLLIAVFGSIKLFLNLEASEITTKLILNYLLCIFFIVAIFGLGFYSIKRRENFYNRKDFQWFIKHPEDVINYKIIAGEILKIELIGENNKSTFLFNSSELEAEKILKKAFPNILTTKKSANEFKSEDKILKTQKVDKNLLLRACLKIKLKKYYRSLL